MIEGLSISYAQGEMSILMLMAVVLLLISLKKFNKRDVYKRQELRIGKGYLPTNRTFQTPACRKTSRRHETKTGSELCTDSQAFHSVLGRTYHRCGPCIQKGVLGLSLIHI